MQTAKRFLTPFFGAMLLLAAGCSSYAGRVREARELFYAGDAATAAELLEQQLESGAPSDRDVIALDLGIAQLFAGQPARAERTLREARERLDFCEQTDISEATLSMLMDDNRRAYAGEDYEKVLVRVVLALANLMHDGSDAEAYSLQVSAKQQELIDQGTAEDGSNPKQAYQRVAAGAYLHGVLREATHSNYDDVARSYAKVVSWEPGFEAAGGDLQRARHGVHSRRGNGVLYVFAFVGRGPYKQQVAEIPTSDALLITDRILSVTGDYTLPPTIAPIKVPQVVISDSVVDRVFVGVNGQPVGSTQTVTDVGRLAVQQHQAIYRYIVARAVARRAIKKAAIYSAKSQLQSDNGWIDLALNVAGVAWEAAESADTRCWTLLPHAIQVLRVELPAGEHQIHLSPARGQHLFVSGTTASARIEDGRNTYLLACFPDATPAGQVLVSTGYAHPSRPPTRAIPVTARR
jgi:hypothetical protein